MLSREVMGAFALAILWINTLLVIGAATQQLRSLLDLLRRLRPLPAGASTGEGLIEGEARSGAGPEGALAVHRVDQVGRFAADDGDRRAILFADSRYGGESFGGIVETSEGPLHVDSTTTAEVWPEASALAAAARCPSREAFEEAWADARKARGFARALAGAIPDGARVWVLGAAHAGGDGERRFGPTADGTLLVSAVEPRALCRRKVALAIVFVAATLAAAALCTVLALQPPAFGLVSTVGAALGLAYFLLVQPAGTALKDALRLPSRAVVRGSWVEDHAADFARDGTKQERQAA
jgi:hypothetical protein